MTEAKSFSKKLLQKSRWLLSHGWSLALSAAALPRTRLLTATLCAVAVLACAFGCSRTVLVSEASPIRIGEVRGTVYAMVDGEWRLSANTVTVPEGWYCLPPSYMDAIEASAGNR